MPTKRRRRLRQRRPVDFGEVIVAYLEEREPVGVAEDEAFLELRLTWQPGGRIREAWQALGEEIARRWARERPGTRPRAWWRLSAPEPRRQLSGPPADPSGAYADHLDRGILPAWAIHPAEKRDLISWESEAQYLSRLNLFLPGERARVRPRAFAPERC